MKTSKLIVLLSTFSSSELLGFRDWVASPFFNKNQELVLFYQYLKKLAPLFPAKKIKRQVVFTVLYPNKKYDDKQLNYLMSMLLKLAEQFIAYQQYQQQGTLPAYHTLSALIERNLEKHYNYLYKKARKKLEQHPLRNANYYYQQFLLSDIADKHFEKKGQRIFDQSLQLASDYFDLYYLSNKLRYATEMLDRQQVVSASYQLNLVDEISAYLKKNPHEDIPSIAIYHQILNTLIKEDAPSQLEKLKDLMRQHHNKFTPYEMKQIYFLVLNYCTRKIGQGKRQFAEEALNLYLEGIDKQILLEGNLLSPWTYKNVITLGIGLKRFAWTEQFIFDYNNQLGKEFQQDALHYSLADLYYRKGDFQSALKHLSLVTFSDIYYNLGSKLILIKIYYESGEDGALLSLLASFNIFLTRNKLIPNTVKTSYKNFVKFISKLLKVPPAKLNQLKLEVQQTEILMDKAWILKQIEALES